MNYDKQGKAKNKIAKLAIALSLIFAMGTSACGNSNSGETTSEEQKSDSTETQSAKQTTPPDLRFLELSGPVKTCKYLNDYGGISAEYAYNEKGVFTEIYGTVTRNEKGQIVKLVQLIGEMGDDEPSEEVTEYEYDADGYLAKQHWVGGTMNYTYQDGKLVKLETVYKSDNSTASSTYEYVEFDEKGNWTKRVYKTQGSDPGLAYSPITEVREITYFE